MGSVDVPVAYYGLFAIFATQKINIFMTLLQRNQYLLPKTNDKNQSNGATTTAQLPTTPSTPHSGKPWRGAALTFPNAPYFVVGGGIPIRIHKLTPYGVGMREKLSHAQLTMHWIFHTAVADYGKGRTFTGSWINWTILLL